MLWRISPGERVHCGSPVSLLETWFGAESNKDKVDDPPSHFGHAAVYCCFLFICIRKMQLMWWTAAQQENWVIKMILIEAGYKINGCVCVASCSGIELSSWCEQGDWVSQSAAWSIPGSDVGNQGFCFSRQSFPGSSHLLTDVTVSLRASLKLA